jgi:hypothetical protein
MEIRLLTKLMVKDLSSSALTRPKKKKKKEKKKEEYVWRIVYSEVFNRGKNRSEVFYRGERIDPRVFYPSEKIDPRVTKVKR